MAVIIGRKVGMTQIFGDDGARVPLTVIEAGPCHVTQVKTQEHDGYDAVQLGFGTIKPKGLSKPELGHLKKAGAPPIRHLHEFPADEFEGELALGDIVTVEPFEPGQMVRVTGTSKGKGYAGTIKRHNFKRGPKTHGSDHHRAPGSIGPGTTPGRVYKGMRMAGHMGDERVTVKKVRVVRTDPERNLLLVNGSLPGSRNAVILVKKA